MIKPEDLLSSQDPKKITHQTLVTQLMDMVSDISEFEEKRNLAAADRASRSLGEFLENVHKYKKNIVSVKQSIRKSVKSNNGKKTD